MSPSTTRTHSDKTSNNMEMTKEETLTSDMDIEKSQYIEEPWQIVKSYIISPMNVVYN